MQGVARLKIAYVGGGSTRAAGTVAGFIAPASAFAGSEIVLIDLDADRLELVRRLAERHGRGRGADLTVTATTDRRAGLDDCDAVLTSYRPGGFEARVLDEKIPLAHGVIGQETQGPGGFFMALRSIHVMQGILADMAAACPGARIFNYTNPVNVVAQAVRDHTDVPFVSLCEGPIDLPRSSSRRRRASTRPGVERGERRAQPRLVERAPPLRRARTCCPLLRAAWARRADDPELRGEAPPRCCAWPRPWTPSRAATSSTTTSSPRCWPS